MPSFEATSGRIYFEQRGARANPPVLMVQGAGCQLIQWPDSLIDGIADAGFRVILFDNHGVGLSERITAPAPSVENLIALMANPDAWTPAITLSAMARDAVDLLDHVGQSGAHVVGASMGGMIGQRMAYEYPERVYSLTAIMSSSGNPDLPGPSADVVAAMANALTDGDRQAVVAATRELARVNGGPHFDSRELGIGRFAEAAYDRSYRPEASPHHLAAVACDGDRRKGLAAITAPLLAIHGTADPLIPAAASQDIVDQLPGARLELIENMGHDIAEPVVAEIVAHIVNHLGDLEVAR